MTGAVTGLELARTGFLRPTPRGAERAVRSPEPDPVGALALRLLQGEATPWIDLTTVTDVTGARDPDEALELLLAAQERAAVEAVERADRAPGPLPGALPSLLEATAPEGLAVLVGPDGLPVASAGGAAGAGTPLQASLAADLAGRALVLAGAAERACAGEALAGMGDESWGGALVGPAGVTTLGAWPLYVAGSRLVLAVTGLPRFDHPAFTALVWALVRHSSSAST